MSQKQNHVAIAYDKRGQVIAIGRNSYVRTHPLQAEYARRVGKSESVYIHAEIDCLIRSRGIKIHRMFITRINRDGEYASSKPCDICQLALKEFGIKHIGHS